MPYSPPTSFSSCHASALTANPSSCILQYASSTSSVIQVPSCPGLLISLQCLITCSNALLVVNKNSFLLIIERTVLFTFNSDGNKTNRGSGLHQIISAGCCALSP